MAASTRHAAIRKMRSHRYAHFLPLLLAVATILRLSGCVRHRDREPDLALTPGERFTALTGAWRFQYGDDPSWHSPAIVDSAWPAVEVPGMWWQYGKPRTGIAWYRARIAIGDTIAPGGLALFFEKLFVATEVYWDGELIARNGRVAATAHDEIPGDEAFLCAIPASRAGPGTHLLALRVSNHHTLAGGMQLAPKIGRYETLLDFQSAHQTLYGFLFGIFFVSGLYHLSLYWGGRQRREYLLFALLSFCFAIFVFLDLMGDLIDANRNFYVPRVQIIWIDSLALVALAFSFIAKQFDYPRLWLKRAAIAGSFLLMAAVFYRENIYDMHVEWQLRNWWIEGTAVASAYLALWALMQRRPGSLILVAGTLILGLGGFLSIYLDSSLIAFGAFAVFIFTMSITLSTKMRALENEIKRMMQMFRLFVPDQVLDRIATHGIESIRLGSAEEGTASILFSDIRSFSTIAEELTPGDTLGYLNAFMQRMTPVIQRHNGFVNQFVGDAIMAIFYTSTHSFDAVNSAISMRRTLHEFNLERQKQGDRQIEIGIGINTGRVIVGTIGSETRMESAVIGDAVNLGSRIEQLTKRYRVGILITDNNYLELPDRERYCSREVDIVQVKGKSKVVTLYEIFDADPEPLKQQKAACIPDYYQGVLYYRAMEWEKAVAAFSRALKIYPRDPVAELYIERCILLQRQPPPPEWNGVTVLDAK